MGLLNRKKVSIVILNNDAVVPTQATEHSAGYDLYSVSDEVINPGEYKAIPTGIAIQLPICYEAQVRPRSGLAIKNGITVLNAPGTIDSDYRGEIKVILINHSKVPFSIEKGMRIAQLIVSKVTHVNFIKKTKLTESVRGIGGFGSTGKK